MKIRTERDLYPSMRKELERQPGSVVFKHSDGFVSGIPDFSFSYNKRTSWLELKIGPKINERGQQQLTMMRLGRSASAFYVVWDAELDITYVVRPQEFDEYRRKFEIYAAGWDPTMVAKWVRDRHRDCCMPPGGCPSGGPA